MNAAILTREQCESVRGLLEVSPSRNHPHEYGMDGVLTAIILLLANGLTWRSLPSTAIPWRVVRRHFLIWTGQRGGDPEILSKALEIVGLRDLLPELEKRLPTEAAWLALSLGRQISPREKFETKFRVSPGCWNWLFCLDSKGYGQFLTNGRAITAHRFSYEIYCGEIHSGLFVLHSCDNRRCVNPDHLRLGTHADNMRDLCARGPSNLGAGEKSANSKLTEAQVRDIYADPRAQKVIAAEYGVSKMAVSSIKTKRSWRHIHGLPALIDPRSTRLQPAAASLI